MNVSQWSALLLGLATIASLSACNKGPEQVKVAPDDASAKHAAAWQQKNQSGLSALEKHDLNKAETDLVEGLKEAEACSNEDPRVAVSLNNLASLYENKGMFQQCGSYLRRSRELFKKAYGENNPMIPVTLRNEARILTKQKKYDESLPLYEEAIKGMEKQKQVVADLTATRKEYADAEQHATKHDKPGSLLHRLSSDKKEVHTAPAKK